jgi:hypothetical protein
MQTQSKRKSERSPCETPIQFLYLQPDQYHNSHVFNYSDKGLFFKSMQPLEPDSQISIIMPDYSPRATGPEAYQSYKAAVRWCRKISDEKSSQFGVGVEILEKSHERLTDIEPRTRQNCDRCDALLTTASVCRLDGSICLCPECFDRLEEIPEGIVKSDIKRILDGNVI